MLYRIVRSKEDESFDVIVEDGGIASVHHNGIGWITTYHKIRLTVFDSFKEFIEEAELHEQFFGEYSNEEAEQTIIQDALNWLVFPRPQVWEQSEELFKELLP